MNQVFEFIGRIILGELIVTMGYYTLLGVFKLVRSKKGLDWLKGKDFNDLDALNQGCFIAIVGMISFSLTVIGMAYLLSFLSIL
jgi:hypothetical protein